MVKAWCRLSLSMSSVFLAPSPTKISTWATGLVGGASYSQLWSGGDPAPTAAWTGVWTSAAAWLWETSVQGSGGAAGAAVVVAASVAGAAVTGASAALLLWCEVPPHAARTASTAEAARAGRWRRITEDSYVQRGMLGMALCAL